MNNPDGSSLRISNTTFRARSSRKSCSLKKISGTEDFEKGDFEGERFLNIATEIVPQFFQPLDSAQYVRRGDAFRENGGFLFCSGQNTPGRLADVAQHH